MTPPGGRVHWQAPGAELSACGRVTSSTASAWDDVTCKVCLATREIPSDWLDAKRSALAAADIPLPDATVLAVNYWRAEHGQRTLRRSAVPFGRKP